MFVKIIRKLFLCLLLLTPIITDIQASRMIAFTMDDLPFVGEEKNFHLNLIIDCIQKNHIPITGFVIAGAIKKQNWQVLYRFKNAGLSVGNHTLTHANLNKINAKNYIQEIDSADTVLQPLLTIPKYFRYPYLAMGQGRKRAIVLKFLQDQDYRVAPITIDSKDFVFNQQLLSIPEVNRRAFLEELKIIYLDYIWLQTLKAEEINKIKHQPRQAQILLLHANL